MEPTVDLAALWGRIWTRRLQIFTLVFIATALVAVVAFLLPPWYQAQAELMPPGEEASTGLAGLLRGVAVPGVRIPTEVTPADVFMVVLQSRRIGEQVVDRFNLRQLYKKKFMVDALKELHSHTKLKLTQAGTIQIAVEDRDRKRAADMAGAYVEYLDQFNRQVRMTKGRRTRLFI